MRSANTWLYNNARGLTKRQKTEAAIGRHTMATASPKKKRWSTAVVRSSAMRPSKNRCRPEPATSAREKVVKKRNLEGFRRKVSDKHFTAEAYKGLYLPNASRKKRTASHTHLFS